MSRASSPRSAASRAARRMRERCVAGVKRAEVGASVVMGEAYTDGSLRSLRPRATLGAHAVPHCPTASYMLWEADAAPPPASFDPWFGHGARRGARRDRRAASPAR